MSAVLRMVPLTRCDGIGGKGSLGFSGGDARLVAVAALFAFLCFLYFTLYRLYTAPLFLPPGIRSSRTAEVKKLLGKCH